MGSHRVVLPEAKFSGEEDVREFLRDFEIYVTVNEWTDEKAGQYLAVYLKDDAKAFYHQQSEAARKRFSELSKALKQRYEGGLALLKYERDFNSRSWDNWVEVPKVPCLRQYAEEENGQVDRGLVQSLLMFAEFAMDVVTGLEAARL